MCGYCRRNWLISVESTLFLQTIICPGDHDITRPQTLAKYKLKKHGYKMNIGRVLTLVKTNKTKEITFVPCRETLTEYIAFTKFISCSSK